MKESYSYSFTLSKSFSKYKIKLIEKWSDLKFPDAEGEALKSILSGEGPRIKLSESMFCLTELTNTYHSKDK